MPDGLRIYVINLARSPHRLARISAALDRLGLSWERVEAMDGRSFGPLPWPDFDHVAYQRSWGKVPHPNELGCYLSHLRTMERFLASGAPYALILEDDAEPDDDLPDLLSQLIETRDQWDVVKIAGLHWAMPVTIAPLRNRRRLVAFTQRNTGSAAYMLSRRAAEAYVRGLLPMTVPYDHAFDQVWRFGLRMRGVVPPAIQAPAVSEIGYEGAPGSYLPRRQRLPAAFARARIEIARVFNYVARDPVWLLWLRRKSKRIGGSAEG